MGRKSGINMSDVKLRNRGLILNQLKHSPKSRKDIATTLKLTPAAITLLVNELIEQGCIRESGLVNEPARVGRKKVFIELDKSYRYSIGVNIEGTHMNIGIGNLKFEVLDYLNVSILGLKPVDVLNLCVTSIEKLIKKLNIDKKKLLGIGVGIVGKVNTKEGLSEHAYGIWNEVVPIKKILEEKLDLQVIVENNVRALALAEMELRLHRKINNMIFMKLGPGIGSAIILEKDIYKGSHNNSGELGHMMVNLNGKKCQCGQNGCLETEASILALIEEIKEGFTSNNYEILYKLTQANKDKISENLIIEAYKQHMMNGKKPLIVEQVDKLICYLAVGIVNTIKMYDPHKLILYSKMFNHNEFFKKLIAEILKWDSNDELDDRIEATSLDAEKCIGGIVLAIEELFFNAGAFVES